jgi:UDP-N-acetylmuramate dehydrogenase
VKSVREDVALAPLTTLGVGGPARHFIEARTPDDVRASLAWANARGQPAHILGGGSNLLVADRGLEGLVLRVRIEGIDVRVHGRHHMLIAGAGEPWDAVVARAVEEDLTGIECLSGIPGDVGATPIQNVGAYGQEVSDTIDHVEGVDRATGERLLLTGDRCGFAYRDSHFKGKFKDRYVITGVAFSLERGRAPELRYAELKGALAGNESPSLADVRAAVLALRRRKSMVYDTADANHRSAGSFFTNPIVDAPVLEGVAHAARRVLKPGEKMPEFAAGPGLTKLSAAWLIERAGFCKGAGEGRVGLSTNHTLAIVNRGGATAAEIVQFALTIKRGVFDRFGVSLVPEPVFAGFEPHETAALLSR